MSSVAEQFCAVVQGALLGATDAADRVYRRRIDAYDASELPAIEIHRGEWPLSQWGQGVDRGPAELRVSFVVADGLTAETTLDALHMQAHAVLMACPDLASVGSGLHCTGTLEPEVAPGEPDVARMTATYQLQTLISAADLSRRFRSAT
ncbi:hypothetical protein [Niveibacterium sp.]|uniref:hypothetical protein n=1 Tax=Niveibacterium sp. TaxID=2017444 RepID=UPI0035B3230E